MGFEPTTPGLKVRSSAAELTARLSQYRRRPKTCQTLGIGGLRVETPSLLDRKAAGFNPQRAPITTPILSRYLSVSGTPCPHKGHSEASYEGTTSSRQAKNGSPKST